MVLDQPEKRDEAKPEGEGKETGTAEDSGCFSRRTVKVTREHNEECHRLLKLVSLSVVIVRNFNSSFYYFSLLFLVSRHHLK